MSDAKQYRAGTWNLRAWVGVFCLTALPVLVQAQTGAGTPLEPSKLRRALAASSMPCPMTRP